MLYFSVKILHKLLAVDFYSSSLTDFTSARKETDIFTMVLSEACCNDAETPGGGSTVSQTQQILQ